MSKSTCPPAKPFPAPVQRKTNQPATPQTRTTHTAPQAHRPQAKPNAVQRKVAHLSPSGATPAAPPAYRPQSAPKVLQTKKANGPLAQPARRGGGPGLTSAPRSPQPVSQNRPGTRPQGRFGSRTIQRFEDDDLEGVASLFREPEARPRVRVGGQGAGAIFLAVRNWNPVYNEALAVLRGLEQAGTEFDSVDEIIAHVNRDQQVINALADAVIVGTLTGGVQVRVRDIRNGT